jgi:hypothetical protein
MYRRRLTLALLFVLPLAAWPAARQAGAQSSPDELTAKVDGTVGVARETQSTQDVWAIEKSDLELRYRSAKANVNYLNDRLAIELAEADALEAAVRDLERMLSESTQLQEVIQDSMNVALGRLERAVAHDLPFLPEERKARLASLKQLMAKPDVDSAEKLRQLLEAMLVEAQYGETVEVTQEPISLDGDEVYVDMLRVGRLVLFWKTPDGARIGTYDPNDGWVDLPSKYLRTVSRAMEMASRMRPVELINLPLGRIER